MESIQSTPNSAPMPRRLRAAPVQPVTVLFDLERFVEDLRSLEGQVEEAIPTARRHGASWSQVGRILGVSKQAAQQRWG